MNFHEHLTSLLIFCSQRTSSEDCDTLIIVLLYYYTIIKAQCL